MVAIITDSSFLDSWQTFPFIHEKESWTKKHTADYSRNVTTYILELHMTEELTEHPDEKYSNEFSSVYKSGCQHQTQFYRNLLTNVSLDSITGLAGKSISVFTDHFMKFTSKTAASKFYLQCNYILRKLCCQLLCCCAKEQYKHFQRYCIHCYVKNKFILKTFLTPTNTKEHLKYPKSLFSSWITYGYNLKKIRYWFPNFLFPYAPNACLKYL